MTLTDEQQQFVDSLRSQKYTLHQLRMQAQGLPRSKRVGALLHIFTDSNNYNDQQTAGRLLLDLKPTCPHPLPDVLDAIAPNWNVSVEELVYYLSDVFGPVMVVDTALELASKYDDDDRRNRALSTVAWWLKRRVEDGG
ncbi:hypothetical protein [Alienimonas chondri]|uniref:hypothetical protein n=1 Tax=Alienimonas chondri TaxID=2681879 RepID=UPI001489234D|nr:hypothetical protein [Alienimonas chondri]